MIDSTNETLRFYTKSPDFPQPTAIFRLMKRFNFLLYTPLVRQLAKRVILKGLPNVKNSGFTPGFYCMFGHNLYAENTWLNNVEILDYAKVQIGEKTVFGGGNLLLTSSHDLKNFDWVIAKPIIIGKNVWITERVIILGGVTIGDNSVIGAGSVVTKNIPSNVFAAGNPCKVIKTIERS